MKKIFLLIAVLCMVHPCFSQTSDQLDTLINAYARLHKFNGSVLVAKNGTILLNKGYGYRNAANKVANNEQTIFQLGSITKQFTSAVILRLQEEKKLSVSDKLSKYFPGYPKGDSITIGQLLTHTSGIYNYTNNRDFMANETGKHASREKMMALFRDKPLDFSPGTGWNYSNSGYCLLGYIIEEVTGKSYEQAVRKYIFTPLRMAHSGFDFTRLESDEKATGYFKLDDTEATTAPVVDSSVSFSAGAIYSTTGDLYLWHRALQQNIVLSKPEQEKAYTPVKNQYGYGWSIDSIEDRRRVSHAGGIPGFTTNIARVPEDDVCVVLLSNASDNTLGEMTQRIFAILYGKGYELPKERTTIQVPEEKLKEYEGEYEIKPGLNVTMSIKAGELVAAPTGQPTAILYGEREDFFFLKSADIQIEFTRDDKKAINGFILHQNGAKIPCKKIK
ncbi:MAG: serine hydrolase [Bacteroidota bacterium]|nr:serine hydrolase [Bacteroidota bacterium]